MNSVLEQLLAAAGAKIFARGVDYFHQGKVTLGRVSTDEVSGKVRGSGLYNVRLWAAGGYECDCPMGYDGETCKHVVAVALAWQEALGGVADLPSGSSVGKAGKVVPLAVLLEKQTEAQLREWLLVLARQDSQAERQLRLWLSEQQADEKTIKAQLDKLIGRPRFIEYGKVGPYVRQVGEVVPTLQRLLARGEAAMVVSLGEWAIKRLTRVMEQADDSNGSIGGLIHDMAVVWQQALPGCGLPEDKLARLIYACLKSDDYGFFPVEDIFANLPRDVLDQVLRLATKDWSLLPTVAPGGEDVFDDFNLLDGLMVTLAKLAGDTALQIAVSQRHLGNDYRCLCHAELLYGLGQQREAIRQLELFVGFHPDSNRLRLQLAEYYVADGLDDEALVQVWACFEQRMCKEHYLALRQIAGQAWPQWRARALARLADLEARQKQPPLLDLRVDLLLAEGAVDEVVATCAHGHFGAWTARKLADACAASHAEYAARLYDSLLESALQGTGERAYQEAAGLLARLKSLWPADLFQTRLGAIRQVYARRKKFIEMIAGM